MFYIFRFEIDQGGKVTNIPASVLHRSEMGTRWSEGKVIVMETDDTCYAVDAQDIPGALEAFKESTSNMTATTSNAIAIAAAGLEQEEEDEAAEKELSIKKTSSSDGCATTT